MTSLIPFIYVSWWNDANGNVNYMGQTLIYHKMLQNLNGIESFNLEKKTS